MSDSQGPPSSSHPAHSQVPQALADSFTALIEAESESLLLRLREPLPALARCSDHLRVILESLEAERAGREKAMRSFLESHGHPTHPAPGLEDDPFFTLLSSRFLLLKVAEAQELLRTRYDNALTSLAASAVPQTPAAADARALLQRHADGIRAGYETLMNDLRAMGLEPEAMP